MKLLFLSIFLLLSVVATNAQTTTTSPDPNLNVEFVRAVKKGDDMVITLKITQNSDVDKVLFSFTSTNIEKQYMTFAYDAKGKLFSRVNVSSDSGKASEGGWHVTLEKGKPIELFLEIPNAKKVDYKLKKVKLGGAAAQGAVTFSARNIIEIENIVGKTPGVPDDTTPTPNFSSISSQISANLGLNDTPVEENVPKPIMAEIIAKKLTIEIVSCRRDGSSVILMLLVRNLSKNDDNLTFIGNTTAASAIDYKKKTFFNGGGSRFLFAIPCSDFTGRLENIMVPSEGVRKIEYRIENFNPESPQFNKLTFGLISEENPYGINSAMPVIIKDLKIN